MAFVPTESKINSLVRVFYSVSEAAGLIGVGDRRRILGWLKGYPKRTTGPLISRDYEPINDQQELSFLDLLEVRFVEHFREQGVRVQTLRRCLETARELWNTDKPLATSHIRFKARRDGRDVLAEEVLRPAAEESNDLRLLSLCTRQYEIYAAIQDILVKGLSFDPRTHLAVRWVPRPDKFPKIIIDPAVAYARPIGPSKVPTAILYEAWKADGQKFDPISDWYEVPLVVATMAVDFALQPW